MDNLSELFKIESFKYEDFVRKIMSRFLILTIALILSISAISACSSAEKTDTDDKASAGGAEQHGSAANEKINVENKPAENKVSDEKAAKMQADGLPELKKGEDYKTSVREKLLKADWKPARSKEADFCGSGETICDEFDEYEARTENDQTSFRWSKGNKFVEISTTGDSKYIYDGYASGKESLTVAQMERWETFWKKFKNAIDKKDSATLKVLMTEKIDGGGDVETASQRIAAIEESNMWESLRKTVAAGTKADKCDVPCRASKDSYLLFSYEKTEWKWSGLGGEGGGN